MRLSTEPEVETFRIRPITAAGKPCATSLWTSRNAASGVKGADAGVASSGQVRGLQRDTALPRRRRSALPWYRARSRLPAVGLVVDDR